MISFSRITIEPPRRSVVETALVPAASSSSPPHAQDEPTQQDKHHLCAHDRFVDEYDPRESRWGRASARQVALWVKGHSEHWPKASGAARASPHHRTAGRPSRWVCRWAARRGGSGPPELRTAPRDDDLTHDPVDDRRGGDGDERSNGAAEGGTHQDRDEHGRRSRGSGGVNVVFAMPRGR